MAEVREHPRIIVQHSRLLVLSIAAPRAPTKHSATSARCSAVMSTIVTLTTCARRCAECSMRFGKCFRRLPTTLDRVLEFGGTTSVCRPINIWETTARVPPFGKLTSA